VLGRKVLVVGEEVPAKEKEAREDIGRTTERTVGLESEERKFGGVGLGWWGG